VVAVADVAFVTFPVCFAADVFVVVLPFARPRVARFGGEGGMTAARAILQS
jgi:hypothetical protein